MVHVKIVNHTTELKKKVKHVAQIHVMIDKNYWKMELALIVKIKLGQMKS